MHVLLGATLIDGRASPVLDSADVIDGQRIMAAGPPGAYRSVVTGGGSTCPASRCCPVSSTPTITSPPTATRSPKRWGPTNRPNPTHLRTGGELEQTLAMGYTTVRDAGGLDAGFTPAVEESLIDGTILPLELKIISPTGGIGGLRQSVGAYLLAPARSVPARQCRECHRSGPYRRACEGSSRGPRHQVRLHRWIQLAPMDRPQRRSLHSQRDPRPRR